MRLFPLAALAAGTLAATTGRADAQYVAYPSGYRSVTSVTRTGFGGPFRPGYSSTRVTVSRYGAPAVAPYVAAPVYQTQVVGPAYPAVAPAYPGQVVTAGYSPYAAGPVGAGGGAEVTFIQSLYGQYLGRQADPQGMQTWVTRYYQLGGDTNRLTQEFAAAAAREVNANTPYYPR